MATPPLFRILDLGENEKGLDRLEHAVMGEPTAVPVPTIRASK